jgi:hypothetical protein
MFLAGTQDTGRMTTVTRAPLGLLFPSLPSQLASESQAREPSNGPDGEGGGGAAHSP